MFFRDFGVFHSLLLAFVWFLWVLVCSFGIYCFARARFKCFHICLDDVLYKKCFFGVVRFFS